MFDEKEQATNVEGLTVQDAWVALQVLDKASERGVIQPTEYAVLAKWRENLVAGIQGAVDKNYDEEIMKLRQMQAAAQQQAQAKAAEEFAAQQEEKKSA